MPGVVEQCFDRKPIAGLIPEGEEAGGMRRALGAGDLIFLSIGAVIGAGIFGSIGTAAAGQMDAAGHVVRTGAGPAIIFSFLLAAGACALAGLCYAELSSMIPQAGSAYAYSYATLGEIVAWIIGWDLILEYAVGNVAVAVSWSDYFKTVLAGFGLHLPPWLSTTLNHARETPGLFEAAPHLFGIPIVVNLPAGGIVALLTVLLVVGVQESSRVNSFMV